MTPIELNTDALEELLSIAQNLPEPVEPIYQTKNVTPSASSQTITPDAGYDALSSVTVAGDANLVASNIKKGAEIFGVTGTYEGSWPPSTITAGTTPVILNASSAGNSSTTMTKLLEITIRKAGTYRIRYAMDKIDTTTINNYRTQLYKNGTAISNTQHSFSGGQTSTTYYHVDCSNDVACNAGDKIQVYGRANGTSPIAASNLSASINGDNGFN